MKRMIVSLPLMHASVSLNAEPVRKIRLLLEGALSRIRYCKGSDELKDQLVGIYKVANALDNAITVFGSSYIPWTFPKTKENYEKFVKPWLETFPDIKFSNSLDRQIKLQKVAGKEEYEQFFIVTTQIGVSDVALREMKAQFASWAMPTVLESVDIIITIDMKRLGGLILPISGEGEEEET